MPQIGPLEILIVAVLALLVFGPEKLPDMARSVGRGLAQFKQMASEVKSEFDLSLEAEENSSSPVEEIQPHPPPEGTLDPEGSKAATAV